MIRTAKQLKDKVRNISNSDSTYAQALIRNYVMERFLERITISEYRDRFILKGGMLVASLVGVNLRATMDIDTTVKALPLTEDDAKRIVTEIASVEIDDGMSFEITKAGTIMDDFEYPGIRLFLEGKIEKLRQTIKIDISTDDVITPAAIDYEYKLMFEDRTISLLTYNTETLLAEKIQTVLKRGIANTRMRDFYDIHMIISEMESQIDYAILKDAFNATCSKRESIYGVGEIESIVETISNDAYMKENWNNYQKESFYVGDLTWDDTLGSLQKIICRL